MKKLEISSVHSSNNNNNKVFRSVSRQEHLKIHFAGMSTSARPSILVTAWVLQKVFTIHIRVETWLRQTLRLILCKAKNTVAVILLCERMGRKGLRHQGKWPHCSEHPSSLPCRIPGPYRGKNPPWLHYSQVLVCPSLTKHRIPTHGDPLKHCSLDFILPTCIRPNCWKPSYGHLHIGNISTANEDAQPNSEYHPISLTGLIRV